MSAYKAKALVLALVLASFAPAYFLTSSGDRWFALGLWLAFSGVVGFLVLRMPVLRCPKCGQATQYFDNYYEATARLTGGFRRYVKCAHCHCVIDRLGGAAVGSLPLDEGRSVDRLAFLLRMRLGLFCVGCSLILASAGIGTIVARMVFNGSANPHRAVNVLLGCGVAFLAGLVLVAASWRLKRRAKRFAEEHHIHLSTKPRIRW